MVKKKKKILSTPDKPKVYQHMQHINQFGPSQGWLGNSACWEAAPPHQLSSLDSPIEMNDVHEYYSIYCCDSHLHATMKSPERCPPMGE